MEPRAKPGQLVALESRELLAQLARQELPELWVFGDPRDLPEQWEQLVLLALLGQVDQPDQLALLEHLGLLEPRVLVGRLEQLDCLDRLEIPEPAELLDLRD